MKIYVKAASNISEIDYAAYYANGDNSFELALEDMQADWEDGPLQGLFWPDISYGFWQWLCENHPDDIAHYSDDDIQRMFEF